MGKLSDDAGALYQSQQHPNAAKGIILIGDMPNACYMGTNSQSGFHEFELPEISIGNIPLSPDIPVAVKSKGCEIGKGR